MGRLQKTGLDYFPLDVYTDEKIKLLEAEQGIEAFAILIKLYQKIYANSYYIEWDEDNVLLFAREINFDINRIHSIINTCFKRNLFDLILYKKHKILTSNGIQMRYLSICQKRKGAKIREEFNLIKSEENTINDDKNTACDGICSEESAIYSEKSTQSKVKKSKVNNIYQNISGMYNETCVSFPKCMKISENRKKSIRARLNSGYTIDDFQSLFTKAESSSFLKGANKNNWRATFDWLIKDANMAKVLDGNYDDVKRTQNGLKNCGGETKFEDLEV